MGKVLKLAARNLARYRRRTLLTSALIVLGMVAVLVFIAVSGSFKRLIVASIDNLPLNLNLKPEAVAQVEDALKGIEAVEASSPRLKFGAMFSNFTETTSIRLNGIDPAREAATVPLLPGRVIEGAAANGLLERGTLLVPEIL